MNVKVAHCKSLDWHHRFLYWPLGQHGSTTCFGLAVAIAGMKYKLHSCLFLLAGG